MGMDGVELILAIEESFQISIEDHEASAALTVGQLQDLVIGKLGERDESICLSLIAFNGLRRSLMDIAGLHKREIRPSTLLITLLPNGKRRKA